MVITPNELLSQANLTRLDRSGISSLAERLPVDCETFVDLARDAIRARDERAFTALMLARVLVQEEPVHCDLIREGAALFSDALVTGIAAARAEGDVPGSIVEMIRDGHMGREREAILLVVGAMWCIRRADAQIPDSLRIQARIMARNVHLPLEIGIQLQIFAELAKDDGLTRILFRDTESPPNLPTSLVDIHWKMFFDNPDEYWILARETDRTVALLEAPTETIRRTTPRVGRNEPCPCGSGKKYKKCCLGSEQNRSPVAGSPPKEDSLLEAALTIHDVAHMRCTQLAKMDPKLIQPEVYAEVLTRLGVYREYDVIFDFLGRTGVDKAVLYAVEEIVNGAVENRRIDIARRLLDLPEMPPGFIRDMKEILEVKLALTTDAEEWLDVVEKQCLDGLGTAAHAPGAQVDLAFALLASDRPALGIMVSRAVLAVQDDCAAFLLLELLLRTRDRLGLTPEDAIEDLIDRLVGDAEDELGGSPEHMELLQVRDTMQRKEDELRQAKEKLAEARRLLRLRARHTQEEATETVPVSGDDELVAGLRKEIRGLKQNVKAKHTEKQLLRRELTETRQALAAAETKPNREQTQSEEELNQREEELLESHGPCSTQPIRIPRFSKQVTDALAKVPANVARQTLKLAGELGAGEQHAFAPLRRLKRRPGFLRARVGRSWRLIFTVDDRYLDLEHLIPRCDLERTVKTLA